MSPDLVFDARHTASGIGSYTHVLLSELPGWAARTGMHVEVICAPGSETPAGLPVLVSSAGMYSPAEQMLFTEVLRHRRPGALFTPHYPTPWWPQGRVFSTVHDVLQMLPRRISGQPSSRRAYAAVMVRHALRRSEVTFAVSEFTRQRLIELSSSQANVVLAPSVIDDRWFEPPLDRSPPGGGRPTVVVVGNLKPHKNVSALMDAFEKIVDIVPHTLVVVGGGMSPRDLPVSDLVRGRLNERVIFTGPLDFDQLRSTVASAELLVQPSLYEGVGLPPLEAMALGVPVLTSASGALRETCGEAAAYFDPWRVTDMANRLVDLLGDPGRRTDLRRRGEAHVADRQRALNRTAPLDVIATHLTRVGT